MIKFHSIFFGLLAVSAMLFSSELLATEPIQQKSPAKIVKKRVKPRVPAKRRARPRKKESLLSTIAKRTHLTFVMEYHGGTVAEPFSRLQGEKTAISTAPITITQKFSIAYEVTKKLVVYANPCWEVRPIEEGDNKIDTWWNDMNVGTNNVELFRKDKFSFSLNFNADVGFSQGARDDNMLFAPGTGQSTVYEINKFTLGVDTTLRTFVYSGPTQGKRWFAFVGPWANYRILPWLVVGTQYELNWINPRSTDSIWDLESDGTDLKFSLGGDIFPRAYLEFYTLWYPVDRFWTNASKIGIVFNYGFF